MKKQFSALLAMTFYVCSCCYASNTPATSNQPKTGNTADQETRSKSGANGVSPIAENKDKDHQDDNEDIAFSNTDSVINSYSNDQFNNYQQQGYSQYDNGPIRTNGYNNGSGGYDPSGRTNGYYNDQYNSGYRR